MTGTTPAPALRVFLVAGEHSGDALGAKLMASMQRLHPTPIAFAGVGGDGMAAEGLASILPLSDVAVMGLVAILKRLPRLVASVYRTVDAAIAFGPDIVVIIDSPEFTQPIAKRIRKRLPDVPIVDYVSPSVWAWRPGRARRMAGYIDHVMALLPFEPEVHRRLGGPACSYVGHPLIERLEAMRTLDPAPLRARLGLAPGKPVLAVLPGSRRSEVERLMQPFGGAVARLIAEGRDIAIVVPAVEHVRALIAERTRDWPVAPHIVAGEDDKIRAFKLARAALAASGTVTLELALLGTPAVVSYRVDELSKHMRLFVRAPHFALANLVLGDRVYPELMQEDGTPENLAGALAAILDDGPARERQIAALARVPGLMRLDQGSPSEAAARIVLGSVRR